MGNGFKVGDKVGDIPVHKLEKPDNPWPGIIFAVVVILLIASVA